MLLGNPLKKPTTAPTTVADKSCLIQDIISDVNQPIILCFLQDIQQFTYRGPSRKSLFHNKVRGIPQSHTDIIYGGRTIFIKMPCLMSAITFGQTPPSSHFDLFGGLINSKKPTKAAERRYLVCPSFEVVTTSPFFIIPFKIPSNSSLSFPSDFWSSSIFTTPKGNLAPTSASFSVNRIDKISYIETCSGSPMGFLSILFRNCLSISSFPARCPITSSSTRMKSEARNPESETISKY